MPEHRHSSGAFTLTLPDGWRATEDVDTVALVAAAPDHDLGFHRNVVVTVEALPDDLDVAARRERSPQVATGHLTAARVLDVAEAELAHVPAQRLLVHHLADGHDVTLEQWAAAVGPYGWSVSTSVAALAYGRHADELRAIAASLELHAPDEHEPGGAER